MLAPARGEVDQLHRAAVGVVQQRAQQRRVVDVVLLGVREILQLHAPVAAVDLRLQQRAERRIAVEAREAGPCHAATGIDQRAETAVPDQSEVEAGLHGRRFAHSALPPLPRPGPAASSHLRTAAGSRSA